AAGWLWAGNDPKKAIAALGPLSVGVVTFCVWAILKKDDAFGFGALGPDETASLKFGVYVTLAGGALALLAAIVAATPRRRGLARPLAAPIDDADDPPVAHLDL